MNLPVAELRVLYGETMDAYRASLARADDMDAAEKLRQAASIWQQLHNHPEALDESCEPDFHLALAFSMAVEARNTGESERIYSAMGAETRHAIDLAESAKPGSMKIWL